MLDQGEIAFIPKEFPNQSFGQFGKGMPIIDEAVREAECERLALLH